LTVEQAGGGDFTSVAEAIDASSSGDTILVGPGHYHEPRRIVAHAIVLLSTDGEATTTIDGDDDHQILRFDYASGTVIDGFRFTGGYNAVNGSAVAMIYNAVVTVRNCTFEDNTNVPVVAWQGASLTLENCEFLNNPADTRGGAVYVSTNASADITDCLFVGNSATLQGGAISAMSGSDLTVTRCEFRGNSCPEDGGAIHTDINVTAVITDCLFVSNTAYVGSAILAHKSNLTVRNNTFDNNSANPAEGGCVGMQYGFYIFENNIITNNAGYAALMPDLATGIHACNIYYNIGGIEVHSEPMDSTETTDDPVYCDQPGGDFSVSDQGGAAPGGNICGELIGAFPVGCTTEPPPPTNVLRVEQDGSGDYLTLAEAIDASTSGDTILVGPGHYHEPRRVVPHAIVLLSTDGEATTTIDGDDDHQLLRFEYAQGYVSSTPRGMSWTGSGSPGGTTRATAAPSRWSTGEWPRCATVSSRETPTRPLSPGRARR
jgi:predicted outer membrane repeat protein